MSNLDLVLQAGVIRLLKSYNNSLALPACSSPTTYACGTLLPASDGDGQRTNRRNPAVGDKLTFSSDAGRVLQNAVYPHSPCAVAPQKRFNANATSTITLDDDLLETLDSLSQRRVITTVPKLSAIFCVVPWRRKYPAARHTRFRGAVVCV